MFPDLNKNLYIAAILFGIFVLVLDFVELVFGYDNAKFVKDMLFLLSITSFFLYCILDSCLFPPYRNIPASAHKSDYNKY